MEKKFTILNSEEEMIGRAVVDSAFKVHKALGPGLLEKIYEVCLAYELRKRGIDVVRQLEIPIIYDGVDMGECLRMDILAGDLVIVECKAVEAVHPVWHSQVLSHMRLTNKRLGYLINFNVPLVKDGIKRFIL